jgi:DNA-binding transcriptional LysR family regulator
LIFPFLDRYPQVQLDVHVTTQHLDLISSGYDVAIRAGTEVGPGLFGKILARGTSNLVASPAYLQRAGIPQSLSDLSQHSCLVSFNRGERPATHWPLLDGGQVKITPFLACNNLELLRDAALDGRGIALLPMLLIRDLVEEGAFQIVLGDQIQAPMQLAVVHPDREFVSPAVRAFTAWTVEWARQALTAPLPRPAPLSANRPVP